MCLFSIHNFIPELVDGINSYKFHEIPMFINLLLYLVGGKPCFLSISLDKSSVIAETCIWVMVVAIFVQGPGAPRGPPGGTVLGEFKKTAFGAFLKCLSPNGWFISWKIPSING
jgi:hypothetical protein